MKDFIEVLGKIAVEADKVKHLVADAINSISNEQFEEYVKDKVHKETESISTNNYDTSKNKERFPYHIDNIKKNTFYHGSILDKTVKDYCIEHRCWAVQDKNGLICTYEKSARPECNYKDKIWTGRRYCSGFLDQHKYAFPTVSWDKSLIAPDGRLILIEGKKEKKRKECKFKAGKWYRSKRNSSIIHCQEVLEKNIIRIDGLEKNGAAIFCVDNLSDWYEIKHYNPNKKKKKSWKRGEPIFVWELNASYNIPAMVKYFHSFSTEGVFAFDSVIPNGRGLSYPRYRKYDPRLVGVPRKDWEDMPYA